VQKLLQGSLQKMPQAFAGANGLLIVDHGCYLLAALRKRPAYSRVAFGGTVAGCSWFELHADAAHALLPELTG
jgi:hypothetical protein